MSGGYVNIHGRRPGRGVRPWLLLPKVLAVAVYFGGLVTMLVLVLVDAPAVKPLLPGVHDWLLIPALVIAMVLGLMLLALHGHVLLRMRWLQVKLLIGLLGLIGGHVWLRRTLVDEQGNAVVPLCVLIVLTTIVIVLGRHKPRLRQNIAKVYGAVAEQQS